MRRIGALCLVVAIAGCGTSSGVGTSSPEVVTPRPQGSSPSSAAPGTRPPSSRSCQVRMQGRPTGRPSRGRSRQPCLKGRPPLRSSHGQEVLLLPEPRRRRMASGLQHGSPPTGASGTRPSTTHRAVPPAAFSAWPPAANGSTRLGLLLAQNPAQSKVRGHRASPQRLPNGRRLTVGIGGA